MTAIERPKVITINNKNYYNAKILKQYDPAYFIGTSAGIREIIKKKAIDNTNTHYATFSKKYGWTSCCHQDKPSTKAPLLLLESWVVANIPKMMPESAESKEELYEYPEAPPILHLEDYEKFKDSNGNIAEIETRGDRIYKGIYFSAKDISKEFEMPSLVNNILYNQIIDYNIDMDYKLFAQILPSNPEKPNCKRQLFITYEGMIKILYSSRSKKAKLFREWATDTLFTIQMGSDENKEELGAKIIGQSVKNVRAVFKTCSKKVPCIYRFSLGTAKTLRKSMNLSDEIKDDFIIIKYGLTDDLDRRSSEHVLEYEKKINGVKLGLMDFAYIDPKFLSEAETSLKEYFQTIEIPIKYEKYTELIAINPTHEKQIKKQYNYIGTAYQGIVTDLITEIKDLKTQINSLIEINEYKLKNKDRIIELKNVMIELKDKDLKYEQLRNEMLELKLSNLSR